MARITFSRTKAGIELDDDLVESVSRFELRGSLDRNKLCTALAALPLAAVRTRRIKVLSVGTLAEHFATFTKELAEPLAISPTVQAFGPSTSLEEMSAIAPDVLFLSLPENHIGRLEILQTIGARMPIGSTIFLANYQDFVRDDTIVPARMVVEVLERLGFTTLHTSYFALFRKPIVPPPPQSPPLSPEEQKRCLFIVGHARSGSSALCHVLNEQPDVLVTFEANWFMWRNRTNPVEQYNLQRDIYSRGIQKSYCLPDLRLTDITVTDLFRHHLGSRTYFGDKIAIGVREAWNDHPVIPMLAYQQMEFPMSNYALCIRDPMASMPAQKKIVPRASVPELVSWWLETTTRLFDFFLVTDRCVVTPFARLSRGDVRPVEHLLGRSVPHGNFVFSDAAITTQGKDVDSFWAGAPPKMREIAEAAQAIYTTMTAMIAEDTGRFGAQTDRGEFIDHLGLLRKLIADNKGSLP